MAGLYAGVVPAIAGSLTSRTVLTVTTLISAIALQIIAGVLKDATGYQPHGHNKLQQLGDWLRRTSATGSSPPSPPSSARSPMR
ncbi:hypothetical protein [Streptomyces arboris]|uniref:hypothetical protein n=1 Tax=Streptomyces arboris TaxID=2600619 RepID=UPI003BF4EF73